MAEGNGAHNMSDTLIFGIDGGGSFSRLRIATKEDPFTALATEQGTSTNIYSVGREAAAHTIVEILRRACEKIDIQMSDLAFGCFGSAGLGREEEQLFFSDLFFHVLPSTRMKLCSDGEILLVGGVRSLEGYCLIAGTGSFAMARSQDGVTMRAGGYGYMLGDEGSAWWITDQAVKRTIRSNEGRDLPTRMTDALLHYFMLAKLDDFVELFHHHHDKSHVAKAARIVTDYALHHDPLATDILKRATDELILLLTSLFARLPLQNPKLVLSGGVLDNDPIARPLFLSKLAEKIPDMLVVGNAGTALDGACLLAASLCC